MESEMEDYRLENETYEYDEDMWEPSEAVLASRHMVRYYVASVIVFGSIGNIVCLVLYRRCEDLRRCRSTVYLTALAFSDLTFLLCLSLVWLKSVGINWQDQPGLCHLVIYGSNAATFLSAWYVTVLTGEMAFALRRPYRAYAANVSSRGRIVMRILVVTGLGCLTNSWMLALTKTETVFADAPNLTEPGCHIASDNMLLHKSLVLFDITVNILVPLIATLMLSMYIGYKIVEAGRKRRHMSKQSLLARFRDGPATPGSGSGQHNGCFQPLHHHQHQHCQTHHHLPQHCRHPEQFQLTPGAGRSGRFRLVTVPSPKHRETAVSSLLIAKSAAYLILNSPSCVHRLYSVLRRQQEQDDDENTAVQSVSVLELWTESIIYMLYYTQFSVNFLLYSWHTCWRKRRRLYASSLLSGLRKKYTAIR